MVASGDTNKIAAWRRRRAASGVTVLAAALMLASCGGDEPEEAAPIDQTPAVEATPETDGGEALAAAVEEWAAPARELGFTVTYQEGAANAGVLTDLVVGSPNGTRWSSASASVVRVEDGVLEVQPEGAQELILQLGDPVVLPLLSGSVRMAVDENGAMVFQLDAATLGSSTIASMVVRVAADEIDIEMNDVVLTEGAGGPLGSTIATLNGVVTETRGDSRPTVTFSALALQWGLLDFVGVATLSVGENGRWSGLLEGEFVEALALLDAFRAYEALDRAVLAVVYAALLDEIAITEGGLTLVLQIEEGSIVLLGDGRGLPDLALGSNVPVLAGVGLQ